MQAQTVAKDNRTAAITPSILVSAPWRVEAVTPLADYRLSVTFLDGLSGTVDMAEMVTSPNAGVFARLKDEVMFAQAYVDHGAVTWPGELDLAPDAMHAAIKAHGVWRLLG